ncbi:hypothetical protein LSF16_03660, partial [Bacillus cereus]
KQGVQM